MVIIEFKKKSLLIGWRQKDWSQIWYQPYGKPDEDGGQDRTLLKAPTGKNSNFRVPMPSEVIWIPQFELHTFGSKNGSERNEMQRQFLADAYKYLVELDGDKVRKMEEDMGANKRDARWLSFFDYAKVWKQKQLKSRLACAKRKKVPVESLKDDEENEDEGFYDDEGVPRFVDPVQDSIDMAPPPVPDPKVSKKRKAAGDINKSSGKINKTGKGRQKKKSNTYVTSEEISRDSPDDDFVYDRADTTGVADMSTDANHYMSGGLRTNTPAPPRSTTSKGTLFVSQPSGGDFEVQEVTGEQFRSRRWSPRPLGHGRGSMEASDRSYRSFAQRMIDQAEAKKRKTAHEQPQTPTSTEDEEDTEGLRKWSEGFRQAGNDLGTRAGRIAPVGQKASTIDGSFPVRKLQATIESGTDDERGGRSRSANDWLDQDDDLMRPSEQPSLLATRSRRSIVVVDDDDEDGQEDQDLMDSDHRSRRSLSGGHHGRNTPVADRASARPGVPAALGSGTDEEYDGRARDLNGDLDEKEALRRATRASMAPESRSVAGGLPENGGQDAGGDGTNEQHSQDLEDGNGGPDDFVDEGHGGEADDADES